MTEKKKPKSNKGKATPKVKPLIYDSDMRGKKLIGGKDAPQWLKDLDTLLGRLLTGGITQGTKTSSKSKKPASWSDRVSSGKVPRTKKQDKESKKTLRSYGQLYSKAHGGSVKKYAKGGGVRKVR